MKSIPTIGRIGRIPKMRHALISSVLAFLTVALVLWAKADFAEKSPSPNGDKNAILWGIEVSSVKSTSPTMRAIFRLKKDGQPGTLHIIIFRRPGAPEIFMHDVGIHMFTGSGEEIPFLSDWPATIALCGASGCGYSEANAMFKSTSSQAPRTLIVTFERGIHRVDFRDHGPAAEERAAY
jgi:hypothetical protein